MIVTAMLNYNFVAAPKHLYISSLNAFSYPIFIGPQTPILHHSKTKSWHAVPADSKICFLTTNVLYVAPSHQEVMAAEASAFQ
jgi:hypothetical protein